MLKIINDLTPFFEDCYRRINVREYAKLINVSPPTASELLKSYKKENLLEEEKFKNYIFYFANKSDKVFIDLSRIYLKIKLKELIENFEIKLVNPNIILFGSLSKAETKADSDIDIAIISIKKGLDLEKFEKKFKRKIQLFWFKSIKDIKNKELANNIINGYVLSGKIKI
tara:strand:+ start:3039 stop:3548 length:510 start_codon:yes stop_codon:yes gene_type:complete